MCYLLLGFASPSHALAPFPVVEAIAWPLTMAGRSRDRVYTFRLENRRLIVAPHTG